MKHLYYYCVWWVSIVCLPSWPYPHDHWVQSFDDLETANYFYRHAQYCAKMNYPMMVGDVRACMIDSVGLDSIKFSDYDFKHSHLDTLTKWP